MQEILHFLHQVAQLKRLQIIEPIKGKSGSSVNKPLSKMTDADFENMSTAEYVARRDKEYNFNKY